MNLKKTKPHRVDWFLLTSYLYSFNPYDKETTFHTNSSPFEVHAKCKLESQDGTEYNKSWKKIQVSLEVWHEISLRLERVVHVFFHVHIPNETVLFLFQCLLSNYHSGKLTSKRWILNLGIFDLLKVLIFCG